MPKYQYILAALLCWGSHAAADTVRVAVASNFAAPMNALAAAYEAQSGHQLLISSASSGKFFAQIRQGAPYHLFFSADQDKPLALEQMQLTASGTRSTYAHGTLALWSRFAAPTATTLQSLAQNPTQKVALANPKFAPYGMAAKQVLQHLGLDHTRAQWVLGENVAQSYQFAYSGNVAFGFVSYSQVKSGNGFYWLPPKDWYTPIRQDVVLLKTAQNNPAARGFLAYIQTPPAREIIQFWGYEVPDN